MDPPLVQWEIEGLGSGDGLRPSLVGVWGLAPRESFEIYVNADANFSLSKVIFLGVHEASRPPCRNIGGTCPLIHPQSPPLPTTVEDCLATIIRAPNFVEIRFAVLKL